MDVLDKCWALTLYKKLNRNSQYVIQAEKIRC